MAFDWSRGRIMSLSARGDTTERHGPLQRLLGGVTMVGVASYTGSPNSDRTGASGERRSGGSQ
jgi:hypothetical protein